MSRGVTLADIAERCNVAIPTVSRILANPDDPKFRPETREKVTAAALALGYRPNVHAHALLTGKSHVIGVSCGWKLDLNFSKAIAAAEEIISGNGRHMLLRVLGDVDDWYDLLAHNRVDYLLALVDPGFVDVLGDWPTNLQERIVLVGSHAALGPAGTLGGYAWHNSEGGRMGAKYLIERGHRHIVVLTGGVSGEEAKSAGAIQAIKCAGLPVNVISVEGETDKRKAGRELMAAALEKHPRTTAVFVRSSFLTPGVYAEIHSRGLRIPDDISVLACYDHQDVFCFDPPLTCVHYPIVEATRQALLDYFAGRDIKNAPSVHFECRLVERASVASR